MSNCSECNCELTELPMCFGANSPASLLVSPNEYDTRVNENNDLCVIDDEHFFIRGHIELPVIDHDEPFIWSVWVSLSKDSFEHVNTHWNDEERESHSPYFGWLCTSLPCYPNTMHLKTSVQSRAVGQVPSITIEPSEHPLSQEQLSGISLDRAHEIIHEVVG